MNNPIGTLAVVLWIVLMLFLPLLKDIGKKRM